MAHRTIQAVVDSDHIFQSNERFWKLALFDAQGNPLAAGADGAIGPQGPPGVDGAEGPPGADGPVGPAGLTWKGPYNVVTNYDINDVVSYLGSSYRANQAVAAATPTAPTFIKHLALPAGATANPSIAPANLTDVLVGDLLIVAVQSNASGTPAPPAGWTVLASNANTIRFMLLSKIMTSADLAATTIFNTGGQAAFLSVRVYRGAGTTTPTVVLTPTSGVTGSVHTPPASTKAVDQDLGIFYIGMNDVDLGTFSGVGSNEATATQPTFNDMRIQSKEMPASAAGATPLTPTWTCPTVSGSAAITKATVVVPALAPSFVSAQWDYIALKGDTGAAGADLDVKTTFVDNMRRPKHVRGNVPSLLAYNTADAGIRTYSADGLTFQGGSVRDYRHVTDNLDFVNHRVVMKFRLLTNTTGTAGILLKVRSNADAIMCYVDVLQLFIFKGADGIGGALSASAPINPNLVVDTDYWLASKIVGNVITHEIYDVDPDVGSPAPRATQTYTLLAANATDLGVGRHGKAGFRTVTSATGTVRIGEMRFTELPH